MKKKIIVTGGAGYIGSHAVLDLLNSGYEVIVIDNLDTGHKDSIDSRAVFYKEDIANKDNLVKIFIKHQPEAVMHFAASSIVGESMLNPLKYYEKNMHATQKLLEAMVETKADKLVFSSTAAIYGEPDKTPITEVTAKNPTNVYGETKLAMEKMIEWTSKAHGIKYVSLRYFNVAGADISGKIGEAHTTETHLIPIILQVALKQREELVVFGNDYPTSDGSCIRDYIHVSDLSKAHILALEYLIANGQSDFFNLGSQSGYSVFDIIKATEKVIGKPIKYTVGQRRYGDPAILVASSKKIKKILGWNPNYEVEDMVLDAWRWHSGNPTGYLL